MEEINNAQCREKKSRHRRHRGHEKVGEDSSVMERKELFPTERNESVAHDKE